MKQCPVCKETFDDQKAFCDMDGSELVDQTDSLRAALSQTNPAASSSASAWVTGTIGGAARLLNVSAPGISRLVKYTEKSLGIRFFQRQNGRYFPTAEAHRGRLAKELDKRVMP